MGLLTVLTSTEMGSNITALIGTIGFPIVACVWMAQFMTKKFESTVSMLTKAVNNNTKIIAVLCTKLGVDLPPEGDE